MAIITRPDSTTFVETNPQAIFYYSREPGYTVTGDQYGPVPSVTQTIPAWATATVYSAGQLAANPTTGDVMRRKTAGTSRPSFDATEAATWTVDYVPMTGQPPGITMTDGQMLAYSAASGGQAAVNPPGTVSAGSAINITGTATAISSGATVDIPSTTYAFVPNGTRELWVSGYLTMGPGSAVAAASGATLQEVSNGVDTPLSFSALEATGSQTFGVTVTVPTARIGVPVRTRTFKLQGISAGVAASVLNATTFPSVLKGEWK